MTDDHLVTPSADVVVLEYSCNPWRRSFARRRAAQSPSPSPSHLCPAQHSTCGSSGLLRLPPNPGLFQLESTFHCFTCIWLANLPCWKCQPYILEHRNALRPCQSRSAADDELYLQGDEIIITLNSCTPMLILLLLLCYFQLTPLSGDELSSWVTDWLANDTGVDHVFRTTTISGSIFGERFSIWALIVCFKTVCRPAKQSPPRAFLITEPPTHLNTELSRAKIKCHSVLLHFHGLTGGLRTKSRTRLNLYSHRVSHTSSAIDNFGVVSAAEL